MRKNNSTGVGKSLIISRRRLIVGAGSAAGGALLAAQTPHAWAQTEAANIIKVGFVSPLTGPLAGFGEADPHVLDLVRKRLKDGLSAGGKKYAVEIVGKDTQSDPSRAGQLAKELINRDKVDFMLSTSTPETVNPVADACEAAGVPSLSTIMPWEAFYFGRGAKPGAPSPFKWTYLFAFGVQTFGQCYTSQWSKTETNKKVGALYPNDADGNAIREHLAPLLAKAGYTMMPLRGRHHRFLGANRKIQTGEMRDLQQLSAAAGFCRLLAPSGATGLHQDGQDRTGRQDRPVPLTDRGVGTTRL